jgi:putative transposase
MPPLRPELLKEYKKPDDLLGQDGPLQQLTKALIERVLDGELTHHLATKSMMLPVTTLAKSCLGPTRKAHKHFSKLPHF